MGMVADLEETADPFVVKGVVARDLRLRFLPHPNADRVMIAVTQSMPCRGLCPNCKESKVDLLYMLAGNDLGATHAVDCQACGYVYFADEPEKVAWS